MLAGVPCSCLGRQVEGSKITHVKIESDLSPFSVGEGVDVEFGAQKTEFLSRDPDEADGVVDAELDELDGDFEETNGAGAVVVYARALFRFGMLAQH